MRTRIKICGLKTEADVLAAAQAGADAIGFNLYEPSARHIGLAQAAALARLLPPFVTPVLLFVNHPRAFVEDAIAAVPQALLQFHGDESPADCEAFGRPYLRAVAVSAGTRLLDCAASHPGALALLLDAPVQGYGGGGKVFDWSLLDRAANGPRLVLSGGLNAANVSAGIARVRPWAVDVSSGVESSIGVKDAALMRRFCQAVRQADAALALPD